VDYQSAECLKGHFLIAMPGLTDPNFFQTVTCISEHTARGAIGIVVNRLHALLSAEDIFKELKIQYVPQAAHIPIHIGGPVHVGEVFILHGPPFGWKGCLLISDTLALSNTMDILEAIARGRGPSRFLISLGCAGWGPGQLEQEIKANAWLTYPMDEQVLFSASVDDRWQATMRLIGVAPDSLSQAAGHA
jgi:putative transcriptional regulator